MGDVGWPSSARGRGKGEEVGDWATLCGLVQYEGEGMDSGSGGGMTGGKVDKCEGEGMDSGSGGGRDDEGKADR